MGVPPSAEVAAHAVEIAALEALALARSEAQLIRGHPDNYIEVQLAFYEWQVEQLRGEIDGQT